MAERPPCDPHDDKVRSVPLPSGSGATPADGDEDQGPGATRYA